MNKILGKIYQKSCILISNFSIFPPDLQKSFLKIRHPCNFFYFFVLFRTLRRELYLSVYVLRWKQGRWCTGIFKFYYYIIILCVGIIKIIPRFFFQYYNNNFDYYTFFLRIIILYHIIGGFEYIPRNTLLTFSFILTWKNQ